MIPPRPHESMAIREHPACRPWAALKLVLRDGFVLDAELTPDAPLAAHLAARREAATAVADLALAVVDACDRDAFPRGRADA